MAVPKKKVSKSRKKMRRSHHKMATSSISSCPNCDNPKMPHRVCPHCGHYKGKEIVTSKE